MGYVDAGEGICRKAARAFFHPARARRRVWPVSFAEGWEDGPARLASGGSGAGRHRGPTCARSSLGGGFSPRARGARWPRLAFSPFSSKPMAVRVCPTPPAVRAPRPGLPGAWHRRVRSSEESLSVAGEAMKRGGVGAGRN